MFNEEANEYVVVDISKMPNNAHSIAICTFSNVEQGTAQSADFTLKRMDSDKVISSLSSINMLDNGICNSMIVGLFVFLLFKIAQQKVLANILLLLTE